MKKYVVENAPLIVTSGKVELTADQARRRRPFIKAVEVQKTGKNVGAGIYEVVQPTQFKVGEEFSSDGNIGKNGVVANAEAERQAALDAQTKANEAAIAAGVKAGLDEAVRAALNALSAKLNRETLFAMNADIAAWDKANAPPPAKS